jgi:hypothetical protein
MLMRAETARLVSYNHPIIQCFKVDSYYTARHDTTRHEMIFLCGSNMFEFTVAGHRQSKTKMDKDCVAWIGIKEYSACFLTAGRCECTLVSVVSCRVVPCRAV